jgi:hypothetical protein
MANSKLGLLLAVAALALGGCDGGETMANETGSPPEARRVTVAAPTPSRETRNEAAGASDSPTESAMLLDAHGLRAAEEEMGTSGALAFGANADLAVEAVSHIIGARPAADAVTTVCGPAPTRVARWAEGFALVAREGRFIGWAADRAGFAFANGIGVGSTYRELGQAFPVSVTRRPDELGFVVTGRDAGIGGTLAGLRGDARVLSLHAGVTCDPAAQPAAPAPAANAAAPTPR